MKVEMKKVAGRILWSLFCCTCLVSMYTFWFIAIPSMVDDYWKGIATVVMIGATPLYMLSAIAALYFGILGKGESKSDESSK